LFAVKKEVVQSLLADEAWSRRLEDAETEADVVKVLVEFCKSKGFKVVDAGAPMKTNAVASNHSCRQSRK